MINKTTAEVINESYPVIQEILKYALENDIVATPDDIRNRSRAALKAELESIMKFVHATENGINAIAHNYDCDDDKTDSWIKSVEQKCYDFAATKLLAAICIDKLIFDNADKMSVATIDDGADIITEIGINLAGGEK